MNDHHPSTANPADQTAIATADVTTSPVADSMAGELPVEPLDPLILAEVIDDLARRLETLEALVKAVTDHVVTPPAGGPWAWRHLGPAQTSALFTQLRDWVDWLITRYDLRGEAEAIPPCWFRHPVAVEELTALMVAWEAAYTQNATAHSDALVNWHDRWLWPTLHRLNIQLRVWAKCTGGAHAASRPAPLVTDRESFTAFLTQAHPPTGTTIAADPARSLNRAAVRELLTAREAVALLPDDAWTPIRYAGRWYAVPDGTQLDTPDVACGEPWRPVDDERHAQLDLLHARLDAASRPAGAEQSA